MKVRFNWIAIFAILLATSLSYSAEQLHIPAWTHNHLLDAKISSNIESYDKGVRGAANHMFYDFETAEFQALSSWHEFGVNAGAVLGVVPEDNPVWWMAAWEVPVETDVILLSGCYPNQPQPDTAWKIEVRHEGQWKEHERGVGGWYDNGRYEWHAPPGTSIRFDAIRISVFSKDDKTSINSIHFRGEKNFSWTVALLPDFNARINVSQRRIRLGESILFEAETLQGDIQNWAWDFGDKQVGNAQRLEYVYAAPGKYDVTLTISSKQSAATLHTRVFVGPPVEACITPLQKQVRLGEVVEFVGEESQGDIARFTWDFGDGWRTRGEKAEHTFTRPGIHTVQLAVSDGQYEHSTSALVRVHEDATLNVPQVLLDSDQKNEQDDQHFLGYAVFSELDLLGINSVHHGGGQEKINYDEIVHVLNLAKQSSAPSDRIPTIYRGANERLIVPASGQWFDTQPIVTQAAEAILAAARGASPESPAWIVPVGPGTNVASAILMAREQGLELKGRIRIMWLGGSNNAIIHEFNGNNDPWSMYVVAQSGIETWIMPAPVGARVKLDVRTEADWYPENPLGEYLLSIMPKRNKPLYDPAVLSAIIDIRLNQRWIKETEFVTIAGPDNGYRWTHSSSPTSTRLIRQVDQQAMKKDIFDSMKGKAQRLR